MFCIKMNQNDKLQRQIERQRHVLALKKKFQVLVKERQRGRIFWIWRKLYLLSNWAGQQIKHQRFTKKFLMRERERVIEKFH